MGLTKKLKKVAFVSTFLGLLGSSYSCNSPNQINQDEEILQERVGTFVWALGMPEHIDQDSFPPSEYIPLSSSRIAIGNMHISVRSLNCVLEARMRHESWSGVFTSNSKEYPFKLDGQIETPDGVFIVKRVSENQTNIEKVIGADTSRFGSLRFSVHDEPPVGKEKDYWGEGKTDRYVKTEFIFTGEQEPGFSISAGIEAKDKLAGGYLFLTQTKGTRLIPLSYLLGITDMVPRRNHDCEKWLREVGPKLSEGSIF